MSKEDSAERFMSRSEISITVIPSGVCSTDFGEEIDGPAVVASESGGAEKFFMVCVTDTDAAQLAAAIALHCGGLWVL